MLVQEDIETIYSNPEFLDVIIELLGLSDVEIETPLLEESEVSDVTRRIQLKILLRMKMTHREKEKV